ncbi:MAG TPA: hypothetical protein VN776_14730, partial [Terracidiphilus sp.]|nr:hypothetical protein [Terracidiphilus sp.]
SSTFTGPRARLSPVHVPTIRIWIEVHSSKFGAHQVGKWPVAPQAAKDTKLIPQVVGTAMSTHHLSIRYEAIAIINQWLALNLDAFDIKSIQEWWDNNKAAYQQ